MAGDRDDQRMEGLDQLADLKKRQIPHQSILLLPAPKQRENLLHHRGRTPLGGGRSVLARRRRCRKRKGPDARHPDELGRRLEAQSDGNFIDALPQPLDLVVVKDQRGHDAVGPRQLAFRLCAPRPARPDVAVGEDGENNGVVGRAPEGRGGTVVGGDVEGLEARDEDEADGGQGAAAGREGRGAGGGGRGRRTAAACGGLRRPRRRPGVFVGRPAGRRGGAARAGGLGASDGSRLLGPVDAHSQESRLRLQGGGREEGGGAVG